MPSMSTSLATFVRNVSEPKYYFFWCDVPAFDKVKFEFKGRRLTWEVSSTNDLKCGSIQRVDFY